MNNLWQVTRRQDGRFLVCNGVQFWIVRTWEQVQNLMPKKDFVVKLT